VNWFGLLPIYDKAPQTWGAFALMLCVPAATVGLRSSALIMRLTRSSMLEVMGQDYVRTARSKGLSEPAVTFIHALRNAVLPVITTIGVETAFLFGGLIVTETVFNIPGVARFLVEAIRWRDYPMVQNLVMFIAVIVVTVNLIVDIAYMFVDPRIRLRA
jgi:peptide/nickel transport system permease protein